LKFWVRTTFALRFELLRNSAALLKFSVFRARTDFTSLPSYFALIYSGFATLYPYENFAPSSCCSHGFASSLRSVDSTLPKFRLGFCFLLNPSLRHKFANANLGSVGFALLRARSVSPQLRPTQNPQNKMRHKSRISQERNG
jgi:hypothetical protein